MSSNPFKNFVAFMVNDEALKWLKDFNTDSSHEQAAFADHEALEPGKTTWRTIGLDKPDADEPSSFVQAVGDEGRLMKVKLQERVLPGSVIKEALQKKMAALEAAQGRKPNKKVIMELKEEVIFDLLPHSHIRKTTIPVLFMDPYLFIFSTSMKRVDEVTALLRGAIEVASVNSAGRIIPQFFPIQTRLPLLNGLTTVARDQGGDYDQFHPNMSGTFVGESKRTIKVKDRDIDGYEIQQLLKQDYQVSELEMCYWIEDSPRGDDPALVLKVNDKLHFKGVHMPDAQAVSVRSGGDGENMDDLAMLWLIARTYRQMVKDFVAEVGGGLALTATDEDDEL